jgi:hypothetical protein
MSTGCKIKGNICGRVLEIKRRDEGRVVKDGELERADGEGFHFQRIRVY